LTAATLPGGRAVRGQAAAGTLYLLPTGLGCPDPVRLLPPATLAILVQLRRFYVENEKSARAFLRACGYPHPLREVRMSLLSEHTGAAALPELIAPLLAGEDWGLMAEAGCPAVADPGAGLIRLAHRHRVRVVPLVGPSAVLLALMASGLNGQHFEFHGYLPASRQERIRALRALEDRSAHTGATQAFIETPYRNDTLFRDALECCRTDTRLCLATDLTLPSESVTTLAISAWRLAPPELGKRPTVFLLWRE
jgi:16S rRNA (cytidine1402-2'-O)-methyltransferase